MQYDLFNLYSSNRACSATNKNEIKLYFDKLSSLFKTKPLSSPTASKSQSIKSYVS